MSWFEWVIAGVAAAWGGCFALALLVFLVVDTRSNWTHGNTGLFGYTHTLARVPTLIMVAPAYLVVFAGQSLGYWREERHAEPGAADGEGVSASRDV